jgi:hypothetical protein
MHKPVSPFFVAAKLIADPPPDWLLEEMEKWSAGVSDGMQLAPDVYRTVKKHAKKMLDAIRTLEEGLPVFDKVLGEWEGIDDIGGFEGLGYYKEQLNRIANLGGGRISHFGKELCASRVVHLWTKLHGKPSPRSIKLYEACEAYWQACGNPPSSQVSDNWRRRVEDAANPALSTNFIVLSIGLALEQKKAQK